MKTANAPFAVVNREDLVPFCPYCAEQLPEIYARGKGVPFVAGRTLVCFCPHCLKVLGIAQGRMI